MRRSPSRTGGSKRACHSGRDRVRQPGHIVAGRVRAGTGVHRRAGRRAAGPGCRPPPRGSRIHSGTLLPPARLAPRFGDSVPSFRDTRSLFSVACWSLKCERIQGRDTSPVCRASGSETARGWREATAPLGPGRSYAPRASRTSAARTPSGSETGAGQGTRITRSPNARSHPSTSTATIRHSPGPPAIRASASGWSRLQCSMIEPAAASTAATAAGSGAQIGRPQPGRAGEAADEQPALHRDSPQVEIAEPRIHRRIGMQRQVARAQRRVVHDPGQPRDRHPRRGLRIGVRRRPHHQQRAARLGAQMPRVRR